MSKFNFEKLTTVVGRHRIIYGVVGALLVASLLTMISMALYVSSGASRLDLSRPGYEQVRKEVQREATEKEFSSNGPIDAETLQDFQKRFTKHRDALKKLDTFESKALDDDQLQIVPSSNQE